MEVVVTLEPDQSAPTGLEEEVATEGEREGYEMTSEESDTMPSTTRLKYSRFKRDGSRDVDEWFIKFESTTLTNQEEPTSKHRIFQGLLKGEALKWYQNVLDQIQNNREQLTPVFLRTFQEAGGEA